MSCPYRSLWLHINFFLYNGTSACAQMGFLQFLRSFLSFHSLICRVFGDFWHVNAASASQSSSFVFLHVEHAISSFIGSGLKRLYHVRSCKNELDLHFHRYQRQRKTKRLTKRNEILHQNYVRAAESGKPLRMVTPQHQVTFLSCRGGGVKCMNLFLERWRKLKNAGWMRHSHPTSFVLKRMTVTHCILPQTCSWCNLIQEKVCPAESVASFCCIFIRDMWAEDLEACQYRFFKAQQNLVAVRLLKRGISILVTINTWRI